MLVETYGYFPGGRFDPRKFAPDREVNTLAEIEAWERLRADGFRCGSALGMGTYEVEVQDYGPDEGEPIPREVVDGWTMRRT